MRTLIPLASIVCLCLVLTACARHASDRSAQAPGGSKATIAAPANPAGTNDTGHPLRHPQFRMITASQPTWNAHWMYVNEVMSYLLKSPNDAMLARRVLAEYGLGQGEKSYLFIAREGTPLVVNGKVFGTRQEAVAFIKKEKLPKLLYVPENNAFPTRVPVWLDQEGIQVWILKWRK